MPKNRDLRTTLNPKTSVFVVCNQPAYLHTYLRGKIGQTMDVDDRALSRTQPTPVIFANEPPPPPPY